MEKLMGLTVGQMIGGIAGIILVFSIFIEITPIKLNPISTFLKWLGKKINGDVISKVDDLEKKIDSLEADFSKKEAIASRIRILRFGDEVRTGVRHSQESFDQVLDDISNYKLYCDSHKDFQNEKTVMTTKILLDNYRERLEKNDFL